MPRNSGHAVETTVRRLHTAGTPAQAWLRLSAADSEPRDWSELGRRVLAEALQRARDELERRAALWPAPAVSRSTLESWS